MNIYDQCIAEQRAADLATAITNTVDPILTVAEIEALMADGWTSCVLDLERKWAAIVAMVKLGDNPEGLEMTPRARWLRIKARQLVATPRVYAEEEKGLIGYEAFIEFAKNFP